MKPDPTAVAPDDGLDTTPTEAHVEANDGADPEPQLASRSTIAAIAEEELAQFGAELYAEISDPFRGLSNESVEAIKAAAAGGPRIQRASSGIAIIPLQGVVTPRGSWIARFLGMASGLEGFRAALRAAIADPDVTAIVLDVNSPGGHVDLCAETAAEIRAARDKKRIVAVVNTMCASAAYWIASQATEVVCTTTGQVGSIGVFQVHQDISQMTERIGIKTTIVSAGRYKVEASPYEPLSQTAKQAMQSKVDAFYGLFVADVAAGRKVNAAAVTAGYGQGRLVLADQAVALGMVDAVATLEETLARLGASAGDDPEEGQPLPDPGDGDDEDCDPDDTGAAIPAPPESTPNTLKEGAHHASLLTGEERHEQPSWHL